MKNFRWGCGWGLRWVRAALCVSVAMWAGLAQELSGVLYYNQYLTLQSPGTVRRINGDGTGDQEVPIALPSPAFPTVSRDGRFLLVTSPDPLRPFKISRDVFVVDLATMIHARAVQFVDRYVSSGILLTNDLGTTVGDALVSSYTVHFPNHKAFSPENNRIVIMDLPRTGGSWLETPRFDGVSEQVLGGGRSPVLEVYPFGDPIQFGQLLELGSERTGNNQGGDGVDWHPNREEVVGALRADIPLSGNTGIVGGEGTVLAVFSTGGGLQPFIRKLTTPTGNWFSYIDFVTSFSTSETQHDSAPAISPNGTQVAYVRHTRRWDTRIGLNPLLAICEIRVINYDGTGDRLVLRMAEGLWVGKLAWSPDGTHIAFDLSPQVILSGMPSLVGDATQSEIHVVDLNGENPRRLISAPATYPTWSPLGSAVQPPGPIQIEASRVEGGGVRLRVVGGNVGEEFEVESSDNLEIWEKLGELAQLGPEPPVFTDSNPAPPNGAKYYRVVRKN